MCEKIMDKIATLSPVIPIVYKHTHSCFFYLVFCDDSHRCILGYLIFVFTL
jgi:hypothetical protein